jgi:hypothetical protein
LQGWAFGVLIAAAPAGAAFTILKSGHAPELQQAILLCPKNNAPPDPAAQAQLRF